MPLRLDTDVQFIKGVGPKLGALLSRHGIKTVQDLIWNFPRAYEDRRAARTISSLKEGELVSLKAQVVHMSSYNMGKTNKKIFELTLRDSSGQIKCKFFRAPYKGYFERFKSQKTVRVVGRVTLYRGYLEFHHPEIKEDLENDLEVQDQILPIYVEIEGFSSHKMNKLIQSALAQIEEKPTEKLPLELIKKYQLLPLDEALYQIHQPPLEEAQSFLDFKSKAQKRIIFEEFFWLELYLVSRKVGLENEKAHLIQNDETLVKKLKQSLPFHLTNAQRRSYEEIKNDMSSHHVMNRLVQGDVGSGKTLVSFMSALYVIESGFQSCLMAPTEILAEQHFKSAQKLLSPLGVRLALLTGSTTAKERKIIFEDLLQNKIDFILGTHALIEESVQFANLGLVIIDEQHRFGVEQRSDLKNKGLKSSRKSPHFLVMTATPIPRTLAMTVYGDLEVSVIDEMPVGRIPIQTRVIQENKRLQALAFMQEQIIKGRQAYIVYPLVEESEKIDLKSATEEFENLKRQYPQIRFGLLHGKMKSDEKDHVMTLFRRHEFDVLVSTTVIEVGVDVPNANIIIIEHAERFGLSQLHQLRGRVGRGEHKSFCVMIMGYAVTQETKDRVQFMEKTTDGFKIAEYDLELRGPGEFLGARQSGLPGFKMAHLIRDAQILTQTREAAFYIFKNDPKLIKVENKILREELLRTRGPQALAGVG